jgi:hypothetical protein
MATVSKALGVVLSDDEFAAEFDSSLLAKPVATTGVTAEVAAIVASSATKSDKIRQLLATGCKRGEVAKLLNIRYQHVRNVEITPIKRK